MKELKNRAEIVAELAKMLREFDLALNPMIPMCICTTTKLKRRLNWTHL